MMALLTTFLSLNYPGDKSLVWVKEQLATAKLRIVQTFDLHSARHALADCPCPHHGNDGQTWLSLVEHPDQPVNKDAILGIRQALEIQASAGI
jgi:hypothetical protein